MANKSGIKIKESKKGTFTAAAKKRGMGVQDFASKVLANKDNYSPAMVKKANFARNATKWEHEVGGEVERKVGSKLTGKNWYEQPIVSDPLMYSKMLMEMRNDPRYSISEAMPYEEAAKQDMNVNPSTGKRLADEYKTAMPYTDYAVQVSDKESGGKYIYPVFSKKVMQEEMGKQGAEMREFVLGGLALAAIGSGLNLVGGLIGANRAKKEAEAQRKAQIEGQRLEGARDEKLASLDVQQEYAPTFQNGGKVKRKKMSMGGYANPDQLAMQQATGVPVEVEGGESLELPNGQGVNVEGPSHAQGGVGMEVPEGTKVYSDKLKVPGKNETFSTANKYLSSKISKYEKVLDDPRATRLAKNTAKRMLDRLGKEQDSLFQIQQKINYNSTGTPSKFQEGGMAVDWGQLGIGKTSATGLLGRAQNIKWGNVANTALTLAPALYKVGQGLFGKQQRFKASDYYNPNEASATNLMRRRTINVDPMLEANRTAASQARYNVRNAARTRGELLGSYAPIAAGQSRADMAAYATKQQAENQYMGELAGMQAQLGAQKAATNFQVADLNARTAAAQRGMLGAGLGQLSQYAQLAKQRKGLEESDRMRTEALKQMFPDVWNKILPQ